MLRRLMLLTCLAATATAAAPALAAPPKPAPAQRPAPARFTIDTPIEDLMADPRSRVIMDKHFPNLRQNSHYFMIEGMSVRQLAPNSNGKLTPEVLAKIDAELRAIR